MKAEAAAGCAPTCGLILYALKLSVSERLHVVLGFPHLLGNVMAVTGLYMEHKFLKTTLGFAHTGPDEPYVFTGVCIRAHQTQTLLI